MGIQIGTDKEKKNMELIRQIYQFILQGYSDEQIIDWSKDKIKINKFQLKAIRHPIKIYYWAVSIPISIYFLSPILITYFLAKEKIDYLIALKSIYYEMIIMNLFEVFLMLTIVFIIAPIIILKIRKKIFKLSN